ncbi:MAG: TetR/AcrR family transcriptional regulator [Candidatus Binatia bacterium]|nr:TetR/AcrR family transcriptional regulator [Candidatus Binatia bacterium]
MPKTARTTQRAKLQATATPPTRELILDAAERLFATRGVDGVAVRDLARELGLTAPSLYNHFPSKQALYDAVLERGLRPILDLIRGAWSGGRLRPEETLDQLLRHLAEHPHLAQLLQRALLDENSGGAALMGKWLGPMYQEGVRVLGAAAETAGWEREELPHLAMALFGMVFSYFTNLNAVKFLAPRLQPLAARQIELQRRVLEKAVYRLLGPQPSKPQNSK